MNIALYFGWSEFAACPDQPVPALYLKNKFRDPFGQHGLASVFGKDLRGTAAALPL